MSRPPSNTPAQQIEVVPDSNRNLNLRTQQELAPSDGLLRDFVTVWLRRSMKGTQIAKKSKKVRKQKAPVVDVKKTQADISTLHKPDILILQRQIS